MPRVGGIAEAAAAGAEEEVVSSRAPCGGHPDENPCIYHGMQVVSSRAPCGGHRLPSSPKKRLEAFQVVPRVGGIRCRVEIFMVQ